MTDVRRVVVIGSGPAGATAALALLEHGVSVTLLESGTTFPAGLIVRAFGRNLYRNWAPQGDSYDYVASGDPFTEWHSVLAPGGLSNYWTGAVPRFAPEDFMEGGRLHERFRWPVSYAELAPYYTYAERLLGVIGEPRSVPQLPASEALLHERHLPRAWQRIAAAAEAQDQGLVYAPIADGPNWMRGRSGAGFNSFERIVTRLARFPHFELRLGAHVQHLNWNSWECRVDSVDYLDRTTGRRIQLQADAVVVAAGALASPKLLLQSRSDAFPSGLGNTQGVLGRFVHDHPKDWCVLHVDEPLPRLDQPLHVTRAPYTTSPPLMAAAMTIGPLSKWDRLLSFGGITTKQFGLVTFSTMLPEEHNSVSLDPTRRDRFGMPLLDIHLRYGPEVSESIDRAHTRLVTMLKRAGVQSELECPREHLTPGTAAHYGGGVRMHASPEYGMLNRWNRLHAVDNVAVVDASSFTTAVEKNPTVTLMALAARAASRLSADFKSGVLDARRSQLHAVPAFR
ncbi:MAG: GMC family oxidoreductase [Chloroflexi bacterium]|nr:GMC family oxidoreductase [Chloroflexota bacterium]